MKTLTKEDINGGNFLAWEDYKLHEMDGIR